MQLYTVHQGPAPASGGDDVVFVLDGFSWAALIVPPLWALFRSLWLVAVGVIIAALAIDAAAQWAGAPGRVTAIVSFAAALLFAYEANDLRRWTLRRRGFRDAGIVVGRNLADAEQCFFEAMYISPSGMLIPRDEFHP
jgi:hypothetical protein